MIEDRVAAETDVVTKLSRESVAATMAELTSPRTWPPAWPASTPSPTR